MVFYSEIRSKCGEILRKGVPNLTRFVILMLLKIENLIRFETTDEFDQDFRSVKTLCPGFSTSSKQIKVLTRFLFERTLSGIEGSISIELMSEKQDKRPGRFKLPLDELRKMFLKMPPNRMKVSEMSASQFKQQRLEDCQRSAYNAHLRKAIKEAELIEKYAYNLKRRDELLIEVANLRRLLGE